MATLTLDRMWIHQASSPDDYVTIRQSSWPEAYSVPVDVRTFAGGRVRSITSSGSTLTLSVSAPFVDYDTFTDLKASFVGVPVMIRDGRGFRQWGIIDNVNAEPDRANQVLRNLSFTFTRITWSEVV